MAERVTAFKSKYTGEQIDELLDVLSSGSLLEPQAGEGQYYSIEPPNAILSGTTQSYKYGIMKIDFSGGLYYGSANIINTLSPNTAMALKVSKGTLIYTFDVPITVKKVRYSNYQKVACTLYYYKDNAWVNAGTIPEGGKSINIENVQQLKVELDYDRQGYSDVYYCIFDFITDEYVTGMSIKDGTL